LARVARTGPSWLVHGYLAPGAVTLLTSQWKTGKTTWISVLLAKLRTGGQLAGLPLAAGKAVIVSEESAERWHTRAQQLDFGDHIGWICRPFRGKPNHVEWLALLDHLADLHAQHHLALVAIDPFSQFMPGHSENDAAGMLEALMPLQRLTTLGLSVLLSHHPRKGRTLVGQAARGSGALPGFVDILLEMRWFRRSDPNDRRRRLHALSRFPETPRELVIEWTADGTDYLGHGTLAEVEFHSHWDVLRSVLEHAQQKLTRAEIRQGWPDQPVPEETTLYRWLEQAIGTGLVRTDGQGHRGRPFRYWLPSKEVAWRKDPVACLFMPELLQQAPNPSPPANEAASGEK
jgi:hypothetical protein